MNLNRLIYRQEDKYIGECVKPSTSSSFKFNFKKNFFKIVFLKINKKSARNYLFKETEKLINHNEEIIIELNKLNEEFQLFEVQFKALKEEYSSKPTPLRICFLDNMANIEEKMSRINQRIKNYITILQKNNIVIKSNNFLLKKA